MGWIGTKSELEHTLRMFGCDKTDEGKFAVDGSITTFMGAGEEFVVADDAVYYVMGQPRNLAWSLNQTGYGRSVVVL
jgi:hypothetical protein